MEKVQERSEFLREVVVRQTVDPECQQQQQQAFCQLHRDDHIQRRCSLFGIQFWRFCQTLHLIAQRIFSKSRGNSSLMLMRSCFILSRSRKVTVSFRSGPFSPSVSKSIVTPKGVPASSCRR